MRPRAWVVGLFALGVIGVADASPTGTTAGGAAGAATAPSAADVLEQVGFAAADRKRVLAGHTVERGLEGAGKHDLGVALALVLAAPAERVTRAFVADAVLIERDPDALAYGALPPDADIADFASLDLDDDERALYRQARAGEKTNFSTAEIVALEHSGTGPADVDAAMRGILLTRLRTYREKGLDGIAPYARSHGRHTDAAAELRRATEATPAIADLDPRLDAFLDRYPEAELPDYQEAWHWQRYRAHGDVSLILVHTFATALGETTWVAQRQFYVSRGYNAEQAIAAFVPVAEGTLVVYWNHTSTDQIGGMAASVERTVGERLMGSQLEGLFERIRTSVATD